MVEAPDFPSLMSTYSSETVSLTEEYIDIHYEPMNQNCSGRCTCQIVEFFVTGVFAGIICLVGIIVNILTLLVLSRIDKSSTIFFVLQVLAIADGLWMLGYLTSYSIPQIFFGVYSLGEGGYTYMMYFVWFCKPLTSMVLTMSKWIIVLLTVYRYRSICLNKTNMTNLSIRDIQIHMLVIVVVAICVDLPKFAEKLPNPVRSEYFETYNETIIELEYTSLWFNKWYQLIYKNILMLFFRNILPMFITAAATYRILRKLYDQQRRRKDSLEKYNIRLQADATQRYVTKVLIMLAATFIVCHTPMAIYPIMRLFIDLNEDDYRTHDNGYFCFVSVADMMGVLNSTLNFFIYYPFIPVFNTVLRDLLCLSSSSTNRKRSKSDGAEFEQTSRQTAIS